MSLENDSINPELVARASFKYFFCKVLGFKWNRWYQQAYEDLCSGNLRFLFEVARGHGKTVFFAAYAIWLVYSGQIVDILFVSYSEEQVKLNIMNLIDKIISTNDHLAALRPSAKQMWGAQLKTFANGSQIRGESFGSSVRGAHPTHLLIDDPLKDRGGMTPEEQFNYYMTSLMGTARRDTLVVVDGTPLDPGDLLEQLEKNPEYTYRKFPAFDDSGEPLFTELFTKEDLKKREREVGSFAFSREFLLQRLDPKTQIFKDQFRTINKELKFPEPEDIAYVRTLVDPAISEKETSCDTAITTVIVDKNNHWWESETVLLQSDDSNIILNEIVNVASRNHKRFFDYSIVIEAQVFQKVLAANLRERLNKLGWSINVIEITHTGNVGKAQRIVGLQPKWEARAIHLLPESPLIGQARYFRTNAKGLKIDAIDALSFLNLLDTGGPVMESVVYDPGGPCSDPDY